MPPPARTVQLSWPARAAEGRARRCKVPSRTDILAPAAPWRDLVVPRSVQRTPGSANGTPGCAARPPLASSTRSTWAQLLRRVFAIDVLACPHCGGRRKLIALLTQPAVVRKILAHLGLPTEAPALAPARAPPEPAFAG